MDVLFMDVIFFLRMSHGTRGSLGRNRGREDQNNAGEDLPGNRRRRTRCLPPRFDAAAAAPAAKTRRRRLLRAPRDHARPTAP